MSTTINQRLQKARFDNVLCYLSMLGLGLVGCGGIYGTLAEVNEQHEQLPHHRTWRAPQRRIRRRDMVLADSAGNGLKRNANRSLTLN